MNTHALKQEVSARWNVDDSASLDVLDLAVSVFFPAPGEGKLGDWEGEDAIVGRQALSFCQFDCYFIPWISVLSATLVDQCGMNPRTTTVAQMDKRGERFYCVPCAIETGYDELDLFTWRVALRHAYEAHDQDGNDGLTLDPVSSFPASKAVRREIQRRIKEEARKKWEKSKVWGCTRCLNDPLREKEPLELESHSTMIIHLTYQ